MEFGLSESQQILKDTARKFFAGECPMVEVRRVMESGAAFHPALWQKMAQQGFTGIIFPEQFGGMGLGVVELALLMEEAGYALLPGPLFSTLWAGSMIDACGSQQQKERYLPGICSGQTRAAFAFFESDGSSIPGNLKMAGSAGKLNGARLFVCEAGVAELVVVPTSDGVYVANSKAEGMEVAPMKGMDLTRKIYSVKFTNTPAEKLSGNPAGISRAMEVATVALTAELAGSMQKVLELTVGYAKARKQFGKPIGSFQAVQHMCSDMYLETESVRSSAYYSAWALQENAADASIAVSIAKMYASDAARNVCNRGIQVHGGMGFTWENDVHLHYRRAKASETMLGDATFHRERISQLVVDGKSAAAGR